jgi:glucans biosynthesis protein
MRVGFEVDPGNDNLCELRLVLQAGGQAVSETWLDRWTW